MSSRVTIKEIAEALGISVASVSRALNDKGSVGPSLRKKIIKKAEEMGYVVNYSARSLKKKETNLIGLLVPDTFNSFFAHYVTRVEEILYENGYEIILSTIRESLKKERQYLDVLLSKNVTGILTAPVKGTANLDIYKRIQNLNIPMVFFDRVLEGLEVSSVITNNRGAMFNAIRYLYRKGHRRIAFIGGVPNTFTGEERLKGYCEAVKDLGLEEDSLERFGMFLEKEAMEQTMEILDKKPTAILTGNSVITLGCLHALRERNVSIPEDVSVVAFDDTRWFDITQPPITAVRQPIDAMAMNSVTLLLDEIKTGCSEEKKIVLENEFMERASVKKIIRN